MGGLITLDPTKFGKHSLHRTMAVLIYRQTLELSKSSGRSKIESTLGIEIAEKIDI